MLNIFNHKGNANQNVIEIPSQPNQNGSHQENKQQQMLGVMKISIEFLQKIKSRTTL
jgi:hypothetical protein